MRRLHGEAKTCPFCGFDQILLIKEKDYDDNINDPDEKAKKGNVWFHCVCLKCKSQTGEASNEQKAIEKLNTRWKL